jgi:hypothetical protein
MEMKGWTPRGAVPVVVALAALAAGCQSSEPATEDAYAEAATTTTTTAAATVSATDQPAGASVTVASVTMPTTGFVTIHGTDANGAMIVPDSIGHVAVPAGTSENVVVPLDAPATAGSVVHVMLHEDTGQPGIYEFKTGSTEVDLPVVVDGAPVMSAVTLQ